MELFCVCFFISSLALLPLYLILYVQIEDFKISRFIHDWLAVGFFFFFFPFSTCNLYLVRFAQRRGGVLQSPKFNRSTLSREVYFNSN